jgi:predicted O-methyltransferase YrrM
MADLVSNPEAYFRRLTPARDALLRSLEEEAEAEKIPIVGPVVGELLFVWARAMQAANILELGTATGYSAIYLGRACAPLGGRVLSVEQDAAMAERARKNLEHAGLSGTVAVRQGSALQVLAALETLMILFLWILKKRTTTRPGPPWSRWCGPPAS